MTDLAWAGHDIPTFVLGTAQLGSSYGIANALGQPTDAGATEIVKTAWASGVRCFDTAQAYGSEHVLGDALTKLGLADDAKIVTKLSPDLDPTNLSDIEQAVYASLTRLQVSGVWGLMSHRYSWLSVWDQGLGDCLKAIRASGKVSHLGVSVYTCQEAISALNHPDIEMIQLPSNVWDPRMKQAGIFDLARKKGKLCFVRSLYLQGLVLMDAKEGATRLPAAREALDAWAQASDALGRSKKELAIQYALSLGVPLVIGAETATQVAETSHLISTLSPLSDADLLALTDKVSPHLTDRVLNPAAWS
ncbi:MAG: aryl-alcohol dehydrogenase-like predicted oxidoreductase [Candidatus Marinamargulisbacteria bacterium]